MSLPLEGVRVLSLEQFGAGPYATSTLADLGADVIKVEDPSSGGDIGRYVPPYAEEGDSLYFETFNRSKRSLGLDVSSAHGRAVLERLVASADVLFSNLRGDVPDRLGIRYRDLSAANPKLVVCSLTGFGQDGPRRTEPGYDYIMQAIAGWMDLTGEPDGPPTKSGLSVVDFASGLAASAAICAALVAVARDGIGMECDVSLFDTAISMLTYPGVWNLNAGYRPARTSHSAHPSIVPFQAFAASDGWFTIAAAKEKFWQRLTFVLNTPELADDPRFRTLADRKKHEHELVPLLADVFRRDTVDSWIDRLSGQSIPCGRVNSVEEALADPQVEARNLIMEAPHERYGTIRTLASPVRAGEGRAVPRRAPRRGEHSHEILLEAGYSPEEADELIRLDPTL